MDLVSLTALSIQALLLNFITFSDKIYKYGGAYNEIADVEISSPPSGGYSKIANVERITKC